MAEDKLPTSFLPAEKAGPGEVQRLNKLLAEEPAVAALLDGMQSFSLILNLQRQAVYVNKAFSAFLAAHGISDPLGQRLGNLAGCVHSTENEGGCGTTESCRRCGSAIAIQEALNGKDALKECRILARNIGEDLDLKVSVKPFSYKGGKFLIMSLADISAEKRRAVLERLFFHDILNTAGGVQGLLALMAEAGAAEIKEYLPAAARASDRLLDQIFSQRELAAAERGELQLSFADVGAADILAEVAGTFKAHEVGKNKEIAVSAACNDAHITTDRTILSRILGNLLKNALEAESPGAKITLSCEKTAQGAAFMVHNPGQMPEDSRVQVFQRSFSTKGAGRGLGTYSIRLLTEKYLKGKISFTTGPEGTTFRAEYPASL